MSTSNKIMFAIWIVLALAAFVSSFFIPVLWIKIIGIASGLLNAGIILTWASSLIAGIIEYKRLKPNE